MSDSGENVMDLTSYSAPSATPSPRMTLAMMDQTENGLKILPQTNLSTDHQSEKRSGRLGHRLTVNERMDLPPLETQNVIPSAMLQSPNIFSNFSSQIVPPSPVANDGPVESSGDDHATVMISNNGLPHQGMGVDQAPEDHNIVDVPDVEPSSPKRRGNEVSNMITATRTLKNEAKVVVHMESEKSNPEDGFIWRKYGQKVIRRNPTTRSYYKCTFVGCKVKKHVERGKDNVKSLVTTYYGIHEHDAPFRHNASVQLRSYRRKKRSGSSMSQDPSNQTPQLGRSPSSSLEPHLDMTQICMTGLSKLPSLPDNQNDEPKTDRVIPNGI